eukprot:TRINITY_DN1906_c0_g1_i1.p1 TRINITY_DN1906_c0_g1~~TRINITY_DN1906_c0_g1_i1.p1  ORF type:complete len:556 (+),score=162.20 TRINITY_DN1906_c0_g1_i1:125-1792(+)
MSLNGRDHLRNSRNRAGEEAHSRSRKTHTRQKSDPVQDGEKNEDNVTHNVDDDPPNSRLFVISSKRFTEMDLWEIFTPYGDVQYCKQVMDKNTGENKGVSYVKYASAEEAAKACEKLDGKELGEGPPLKVVIAEPKRRYSRPQGHNNSYQKKNYFNPAVSTTKVMNSTHPEDNPPRSRLFFAGVGREVSEEDLIQEFKSFDSEVDFEYLKLMRDRGSGLSKGCGFVKFYTTETAERVLDGMNERNREKDSKMTLIVAQPKILKVGEEPPHHHYNSHHHRDHGTTYNNNYTSYIASPKLTPPLTPMDISYEANPGEDNYTRLFVVVSKSVKAEELSKVFSKIPGMEVCQLKTVKKTGESKGFAYVTYSTHEFARRAKEELNDIEFPTGSMLKVLWAEPLRTTTGSYPSTPDSSGYVGFSPVYSPYNPLMTETDWDGIQYYPEGSRLFVTQTGPPFSDVTLGNLFGQFSGLEFIRMSKEHNYGYIKYSSTESAKGAAKYYDGYEYHGTRLAVRIAHQTVQKESPKIKEDDGTEATVVVENKENDDPMVTDPYKRQKK